MKVIVRRVKSDDWEAIYINDNRVYEAHHTPIEFVCEHLQKLIIANNEPITEINGESYYLNDNYAENNGFPLKFSDIPEDMFE